MRSTVINGTIGTFVPGTIGILNWLGTIKESLSVISILIGIAVGLVTLRNLLRQKP